MFGSPKKKVVDLGNRQVELQPKPNVLSKLFKGKPKTPTPAPPTTTIPSGTATLNQSIQQPQQASPSPSPKPPTEAVKPAPSPSAHVKESRSSSWLLRPKKPVIPNNPYPFQFPGGGSRPKAVQPSVTQPQDFKPAAPQQPAQQFNVPKPQPFSPPISQTTPSARPGGHNQFLQKTVTKHPDLEQALRREGIKESAYDFVKRMFLFSIIFTVAIGAVTFVVLSKVLTDFVVVVALSLAIAYAVYNMVFKTFLDFPASKGRSSSKKVERDIIFAARDLIIALRSGMPLFNAITSVSSGYGEASKEFLKVVEKVQLGTPLEDAIDQTVSSTKSPSFRKIMLQASISIRVGADVTSALQSVIDQLSQERVIELRRYGQSLNAIAMFYMLFGIILPSMGIAVLTIMTTFIPIFSVDATLLEVVIVGLIFLQVVFLQMIRSTRPVFSM